MRIKSIELHGFKSFPDRTVLYFGPGISCVVGPNGCGKSNVIDAVKWCMGEQSARSLRGSDMLDVIFAGSAERQPVGYAEVKLTFATDAGDPFPGDYARFTEVEIGRRLHRTGASEYHINQTRCRRRDIVDLFLDTGVGNNLYSVIEQGSIGKIVHAKPIERRSVIDEAAGIGRYKIRREEAQVRLEQTAAQLDRAADVEDEMSKRLRQLERQVVKAAKFRRMRAELRNREIVLSLAKYADLSAERRRQRSALRGNKEQLVAAEQGVLRAESDRASRLEELAVVEAAARTWRDELAEAEARLREQEGIRRVSEQRLVELTEEGKQATTELESAEGAAAQAQRELVGARAEVTEVERGAEDLVTRLNEVRAEGAALQNTHQLARSALGQISARVQDAERALMRAETQAESLKRRHAEEPARLAAAESELREAQQEVTAATEAARQAKEQVEANKGALQAHRAAVDAARVDQQAAEAAVTALQTQQRRELEQLEAAHEVELAAMRKQIRELRALEAKLDAVTAAVRAGKAQGAAAGAVRSAVPHAQVLHELVELTEEQADDLGPLLGERLLLPVVRSAEDVLAAAEAAAGEGRTSLLWAARVDGSGSVEGTPPGPELVDRALAAYERVDSIEDAIALHKGTGRAVIVRGSGERIEADGLVTVGAGDAGVATALRRERERRELAAQVTAAAAALGGNPDKILGEIAQRGQQATTAAREQQRSALKEAQALAEAQRAKVLTARSAASEAELESTAGATRVRTSEAAKLRADTRLQTATSRARTLREALTGLDAELKQAVHQVTGAKRDVDDTQEERAQARQVLRDAEGEHERARQRLGSLEVQRAGLQERVNAARGRVSLLEQRQRAEEQRAVRARERAMGSEQAHRELTGSLGALAVAITELMTAREQASERLERERARMVKLRDAAKVAEDALRDASVARDRLTTEVRRVEEHVASLQAETEALRARIDERYQVSLPGLLDRLDSKGVVVLPTDPRAAEALAIGDKSVEGVPDFELRAQMLGDYERIAEMVTEAEALRKQLADVGDVNLAALEEYQDVAERHSGLLAQREDLEQSVAKIRAAIAKMNRLCRQRFRDAFDQVNEYFRELYPRLVGGGSARLALTDEDDLLATGVEIYVQPPGKRLQNLTLLSGGEKAMTAIALLLSLFKVKPSPFCLLDEVDAPLDEANGTRFNDILKEMAHITQFIVITHNRKTMECGDTLYGVTMPNPGVSRAVSVRLGVEAG